MSDIKRYDCTSGGAQFCQGCYTMTRDDEYGDYVLFSDYEALRAQLAALQAQVAEAERQEPVRYMAEKKGNGTTTRFLTDSHGSVAAHRDAGYEITPLYARPTEE